MRQRVFCDPDCKPNMGVERTENLRRALGAKSGENTLDVVVGRFEDGTLSPSLGLSGWLTEHELQFSRSEQWHDN